jgi:hypothetical protein
MGTQLNTDSYDAALPAGTGPGPDRFWDVR